MTPPSLDRVALTCRIPAPIRAEAQRYCDARGLSLNSLVSLALSTYLERQAEFEQRERFTDPHVAGHGPLSTLPKTKQAAMKLDERPDLKPPKRPRDKCPCGSGRQWRHCHGPMTEAMRGK